MNPTKRQIAKTIRNAVKLSSKHPRMTAAIFAACQRHGSRASTYYDLAVIAIKEYSRVSFRSLLTRPPSAIHAVMRRSARALEHGLQIAP